MSADTAAPTPEGTGAKIEISLTELVAVLAMMSATVAFATDAMLPAFPDISAELSPEAPNRAQLLIGVFMVGLGIGTLFTGPLSDAFGRQRITVIGSVLIVIFALVSALAS